jgi:hypothetical protein
MSQRDIMYMVAGVAVGYFVLPMIFRASSAPAATAA